MTDNPSTSVRRNDGAERYEIVVNDAAAHHTATHNTATPHKVVGFAAFQASDTHIAFTHTEVDEAHQGQGFASQVASHAIADAVSRDLVIIPLCPYMERYLERHQIEGARVEWPNRAPRE